MLRRVQKYIRDHQLLNKGDRVLVCVSGGADSIALWDVLYRGGYECLVAHCNFHLRKQESDRDELFVKEITARYPVSNNTYPIFVKHFDTTRYAQENGISIEMAARELRYQWFAELATEQNCKAIAVAHHQNDQAETVLLNLKRGTGLRGLCGMRPKSDNPMGSKIPVIRPLLCTTRDYIEHYLRDIRKIPWVNDSTNNDISIARNSVRAQLASYTKATRRFLGVMILFRTEPTVVFSCTGFINNSTESSSPKRTISGQIFSIISFRAAWVTSMTSS